MNLDLIFSPSAHYSMRTVHWANWNKENNRFPVRYKQARPISGEALKDNLNPSNLGGPIQLEIVVKIIWVVVVC